MVKQKSEQIAQDDGFTVKGYMAADYMCMGMHGNKKQFTNPSTSICMKNQVFFMVDEQSDWNWGAKVSNGKHVDAICGLGKEKASMRAKGWLARAKHLNLIHKQVYSVTLVPQILALPVAADQTIPEDRTEEELMMTSFLTIGGVDEKDYIGNITWFDAIDSWNQTLTSFSIGE